ncbi:hypothetical protein [Paraburkholderia unamae]|uniref:Uncharacterized protein n=1 Tax=Paraburkholderia unamae TaxID=219649 RepID=A0ACC6RXV4_9BURK
MMALSVEDLTSQASFIFEGVLDRIGATTVSALQPAPNVAVVQVINIVKGPPALAKLPGHRITVQLREPVTAQPGRKTMFFTNSLYFGDGLAVREVGQLEINGTELESRVRAAIRERSEELLLHRLRAAEIVVAGIAVRISPWQPKTAHMRHVSEHDPNWSECVIKVKEALKGPIKPGGKGARADVEVVTLFSASMDIAWYQSPKFSEGDEGIWLLHQRSVRGDPAPGLVSDHPLDFHPISQLEIIRTLIERFET